MEKELLIQLINKTNNEAVIKYLYAFSKDFIYRYEKQTGEQFEAENRSDHLST